MHVFHHWSKWKDLHSNTVSYMSEAALEAKKSGMNISPVITRIELRQERTCADCGATQYRKTVA
jgi:hypothetical protein